MNVSRTVLLVFFMGMMIGLMIGVIVSLNAASSNYETRSSYEPSFVEFNPSGAKRLSEGGDDERSELARLRRLVGEPSVPVADSNFRSIHANVNLFDRLAHLERKVNGGANWLKNPHFYDVNTYKCKDITNFDPKTGTVGFYDHWVCMDKINLRKEKCVVYDFGIRQQPHFGEALARDYGCEVHAFDPSPITLSWIKGAEVSKLPNYHFHPYGGGGVDGNVTLFEYWDWDQISIIKLPNQLTNERTDGGKGRDRVNWQPVQRNIEIPVKTIPTIMKELGHDFISILKIDIEGSEFLMLEDLLDRTGCPPIDQVTLEWHHFDLDMRYGSSPHVNTLTSMLHECGHHQFEHMTPYLREDEQSKQQFRYSEASFCKRCHETKPSRLKAWLRKAKTFA